MWLELRWRYKSILFERTRQVDLEEKLHAKPTRDQRRPSYRKLCSFIPRPVIIGLGHWFTDFPYSLPRLRSKLD
jgi:hypothetical protein